MKTAPGLGLCCLGCVWTVWVTRLSAVFPLLSMHRSQPSCVMVAACSCMSPCVSVLYCRTRKATADATAELSSCQAAVAELTAQVSSKQVSLAGVEASLAAKSKELQEVLAQLQAAAAQEFQDARKLLLNEGGLTGGWAGRGSQEPGADKDGSRYQCCSFVKDVQRVCVVVRALTAAMWWACLVAFHKNSCKPGG